MDIPDTANRAFFDNFDDNPFHRYLGMRLADVGPGRGRVTLTRSEQTPTGIGGSVNGGVMATLVDMAALVAVFSELKSDEVPAGTANLDISYLRTTHASEVHADARVIKRGRQLCVVDVRISDSDGRECAVGRVLYAFRAGG